MCSGSAPDPAPVPTPPPPVAPMPPTKMAEMSSTVDTGEGSTSGATSSKLTNQKGTRKLQIPIGSTGSGGSGLGIPV